jgi:formate dehydrogenase subunit beta
MAEDRVVVTNEQGPNAAAAKLLGSLMENGVVDAVLVPRELPGGGIAHALLTQEDSLERASPLVPVMPASGAVIVSDLTKLEPSSKTVAVVLRPCELRALVELVKLRQAALDGLLIVSYDCPGTFKVTDYAALLEQGEDTLDLALKGHEKVREICGACTQFYPQGADIVLGLYGLPDGNGLMVLGQSDKGREAVEKLALEGDEAPDEAREKALAEEEEKRQEASNALVKRTIDEVAGLESLLKTFSTCILCHNCMTMCPVCYCRECYFESPTFDFEADRYLSWADKKGGFRVPQGSLLFHLTRMNHMSFACVACGLCEQACPSDIPVGAIFKAVGLKAQELFEYVPGRSLEEELPLATFKEEELEPR